MGTTLAKLEAFEAAVDNHSEMKFVADEQQRATGYAWRGAKYYNRSIPVRNLAALMGHTVKTHMKHYGKWTDDEGLMASVQAITKSAASQSRRPKSLSQQQMQQQQ